MSYSTMMVHVGSDKDSDARIRLASGLSEKFHSTLIGVSGRATRRPAPVEAGFSPDLEEVEGERATIGNDLDHLGAHFRSLVGATNRSVEWRAEVDFPINVVMRAARGADLIVVGNSAEDESQFRGLDPGSVILRAGRPVLVVPRKTAALDPGRVMIAWKDTRESRRALADALPFLHEAERVLVVEVCATGDDDRAQEELDDVKRYLGRHRIAVGAAVTVHAHGNATDELLRVAREEGIDLIVAGAYGHSRLGELMFGGVTRGLLVNSPICCMLSH